MIQYQDDVVDELKNAGEDVSGYEHHQDARSHYSVAQEPQIPGIVGYPTSALGGFLQGLGEVGQDVGKWANRLLPEKAVNIGKKALYGLGEAGSYLNKKAFGTDIPNPFDPNAAGDEQMGHFINALNKQYPVSSEVGKLGGEVSGISALTPFETAGAGIGGASALGRGLLQGAGTGLLFNPEAQNLQQGAISAAGGALGGGVGAGVGHVVGDIVKAANSDIFNAVKRLSSQGIPLNLSAGSALGIPTLQSVEKGLSYLPLGTTEKNLESVGNLEQGVAGRLNDLRGPSDPNSINQELVDTLKSTYKKNREINNDNYNNLNKVVDFFNLGKFIESKDYSNSAAKILNSKDALSQARPEFKLTQDRELMNFLSKAANSPTQIDFNTARKSSEELNEMIQRAYAAGDEAKGGLLTSLKKANESDIENALSKQNDEIKNGWAVSKDYYAQNVAPFHTPEMQKYMKINADPDNLINAFVKTGTVDRPNLLNQVMNKLPPEKRALLGYQYLTRGLPKDVDGYPLVGGNLDVITRNVDKLKSLPQMRNLLLGDHNQFFDDASLVHKALKSSIEHHPVAHGFGLAGMAEGVREALEGHPGMLGLTGATLGGGYLLNKALRSPSVQKSILGGGSQLAPLANDLSAAGSVLTNQLNMQ